MILYDMLKNTLYNQKVIIAYDSNYAKYKVIFSGDVEEARADEIVFDRLMDRVGRYECNTGVLILFLENESERTGKYTHMDIVEMAKRLKEEQ